MNNLGVYHEVGRGGLAKDEAEAARWYRRAADRGNPSAMFNLARFYAGGRGGLTKDEAEAAKWYLRAADRGNARAMYSLALYVESGRGGPATDHVETAEIRSLGNFEKNGLGEQARNHAEATRWMRRAAEAGDQDAAKWLVDHP
jgi:TPR repeat protein